MAITGEPERPPVKMGLPLADEMSGLFAVIGILAAMERRDRTGGGCLLDTAMFDVGLCLLSYMANIYFSTGESPERLGSAHPTIYPYNAFKTAAGDHSLSADLTGQARGQAPDYVQRRGAVADDHHAVVRAHQRAQQHVQACQLACGGRQQ